MSDPKEYGREVNEFISQFCAVEVCKNGKWMAYLDPTHDFVREGAQPPGQVNSFLDGNPTYTASNLYWFDEPMIDLSKPENRVRWNEAWACRPCFDTAWGARAKIGEWVRNNRADIVRQAEVNAGEALAYRRRQERVHV